MVCPEHHMSCMFRKVRESEGKMVWGNMSWVISLQLHKTQKRNAQCCQNCSLDNIRRLPPCAVKTCAVLHGWWGSCGQQIQVIVQGPVKQNTSPGEQSEAPRPRWKPGQEQNPGPENQDSQHMLEQPRGYFPEIFGGMVNDLLANFSPELILAGMFPISCRVRLFLQIREP